MKSSDFFFEYEFTATPDSAERIVQVWDIIFALILEDFKIEEQVKKTDSGIEPC